MTLKSWYPVCLRHKNFPMLAPFGQSFGTWIHWQFEDKTQFWLWQFRTSKLPQHKIWKLHTKNGLFRLSRMQKLLWGCMKYVFYEETSAVTLYSSLWKSYPTTRAKHLFYVWQLEVTTSLHVILWHLQQEFHRNACWKKCLFNVGMTFGLFLTWSFTTQSKYKHNLSTLWNNTSNIGKMIR